MLRALAIPLLLTPIALAQPDPILEKARAAAEAYAKALPNYLCQQATMRYRSITRGVQWRSVDVITAEVIYENGHESYHNVRLSGRPIENWSKELGGAWSAGEFGTQLWDLFSSTTAAEFTYQRDTSVQGRAAAVYTFQVPRESSHWGLLVDDNLVFTPYQGTVWIEKESGGVLRLERSGHNVPRSVHLDSVQTATNYEFVTIGPSHRFLLPVHSQMIVCERGTTRCNRNEIDFLDYRKYTGEATISFDK